MFSEIDHAACDQARIENKIIPMTALTVFAALSVITCVVLSILTMTETVNLTAGSSVLLSGGTVMLFTYGCYAYLASKTDIPWKKVAICALAIFLMFAPAVVCGGLALGGILDSSLLMGGAFLAPLFLSYVIQRIIEKCEKEKPKDHT